MSPLAAVHLMSSRILYCQSFVKPFIIDETKYVLFAYNLVVIKTIYTVIFIAKDRHAITGYEKFSFQTYGVLLLISTDITLTVH